MESDVNPADRSGEKLQPRERGGAAGTDVEEISWPPRHFTRGIKGPPDYNTFGLGMDFDMAVLWVAAWCRRGESERRKLLDELKEMGDFCSAIGSSSDVQQWLAAMAETLDSVQGDRPLDPNPMSLQQVTEVIKGWNRM